MKRTIRRAVLLWMLAALLWVLSACGMNNSVEDMFTLPRVPDEYTGLNQQIEQMISGGYEYAAPTAISARGVPSLSLRMTKRPEHPVRADAGSGG